MEIATTKEEVLRGAMSLRSGAVLAGGLAVGVSLVVGISIGHLGGVPSVVALSAGVAAALVISSTAVAREARRGDAFSPLAITAVFVALTFGVGSIYFWYAPGPKYAPLFAHPDLVRATWFGVAAFVFFIAGYEGMPLRAPALRASVESTQKVVVPLFLVGWAARLQLIATHRYFHVSSAPLAPGGLSWLTSTVALAPMVATAYIGAMSMRSRGRLGSPFWALFVAEFAWYLPTGERAKLAMLLAVAVCLRYYGGGRSVPWRTLVPLAAFVVFFAFPFAVAYRGDSMHANRGSTSSSLSRAFHQLSLRPATAFKTGFRVFADRDSDVASVAAIMHRGRLAGLPSVSGELALSAEAFVPRAFVPSKGDPAAFANEFGRAYGLAAPTDNVTSVPSTDFGALYISGGVAFSLLCMILIGAAYRVISDVVHSRRGGDPGAIALYGVLSYTLVRAHEAIPAEGVLAALKTLLVLGLLLVIVLRARPSSVSARPTSA
jgi:hypothetical protein